MTRRALIADIHANVTALKAVFADGDAQGVEEWACLGDICGYGPDPAECADLVRKRCTWSLGGNHDAALFMVHPVGFNRYAREAVLWQISILKPKVYSRPNTKRRWSWLHGLPALRKEGDILYVHASPREPLTEYVGESDLADLGFGPSRKIVEVFEKIERLCFCSHTHWPGIATEDYRWISPDELPGGIYNLPLRQKTLINIGSVGQPRDRNPDACYAVHDDEAGNVSFRRVAYDVQAAMKRFQAVPELDERLRKRLESGT